MVSDNLSNCQIYYVIYNGNYTLLTLFLTSLNLCGEDYYKNEDFTFLLYPNGIIFYHESIPIEYGEGLIEGEPLAKGTITFLINKLFRIGTYNILFYVHYPEIWLTTYKQENTESTTFIDVTTSKNLHYLEEKESWVSTLKECNGYKSKFFQLMQYLELIN